MSTVPKSLLTAAEYLAQERCASFKEYVFIAQDRPLVERYVRQADGGWTLREVTRLDQNVDLDGIPVRLPMSEIYRQITLEEEKTR